MKEKIAYACFCTDAIHEGHRNILREAKKRGTVVAGVLSDREMVRYNRFPAVSLEERIALLEAEPEVERVIVQDAIMYDEVIASLKPDFVVHGDNWRGGPMSAIRENVLANLKKMGGELIEVPYTWNPDVKKIDERMKERLVMPEFRRRRLRRLLEIVPIVKTIEVHDGLTGLLAEKTVVEHEGGLDQFDALWISSLCDSTAKGKPDIELVDMSSRIRTASERSRAYHSGSDPRLTSLSKDEMRFENLRMVTAGPSTETGAATAFTRSPFARRAFTIGLALSRRRPRGASMRSMIMRICSSDSNTACAACRRPCFSKKRPRVPLTTTSLTSSSSRSSCKGPRPHMSSRVLLTSLSLSSRATSA